MAEIWHNKRKTTDAFFVAMVSENLYMKKIFDQVRLELMNYG